MLMASEIDVWYIYPRCLGKRAWSMLVKSKIVIEN